MNGRFYPGSLVFKLYAEQGIPAEVTVMAAHENGFTIEWPSFFSDALRNGWTLKRIYVAVTTAVRDAGIFDAAQSDEFEAMCRMYAARLSAAPAEGSFA